MGNCVALNFSCDQTVNHIFRCLCGKGHIGNLKENLRALQREMEDLKSIQHQVQNKVAREEAQHRQRLESVKVWLTRVDIIDARFTNLLSTSPIQLRKLCLCGLCSKNPCSSYKYGESVFLLLKEVKILKLEGNFDEVSEFTPRAKVEERATRPTFGQEEMLERAWKRLMEDGGGIMGLQGMGGVGKTTLFKKIHNKLSEIDDSFDVVMWVVVSHGVTISKLQEDIAKKLHLWSDDWVKKNESDKAAEIYKFLNGKRFVLMLDDIWEKLDLEAIGVPEPTKENECKVAFTTRSQEVCGRMGDHEPIQVKCLEWNEAWELFTSRVGESTFRRNPDIVELAKKVAEKCHGLPLALSVIGETMASKTMLQEWEDAIEDLTRSAGEFPDMETKILPILKYSYDSLADENIKSCFLYCALFPEDYEISKETLIDYWICEGFIGEHQHVKTEVNKGYVILGTLIRANLLTEAGLNKGYVKMHDVLREMALWIASSFGKQKETFVVQARIGLRKVPKVEDWRAVRRMSLMGNKIEEITCGSECSELTTLFLQNNNLKNLSGKFIWCMQKLVVLDLSINGNFSKLPEQISQLTSLRYLDLSYTSIEQLLAGFQELKKLTHLDLSFTYKLRSVGGISKLTSLRILKLLSSNVHGDGSVLTEVQLLEHLQILTITIDTELGLKQILGDQRLAACINGLHIRDFEQKPFNISLLATMENLRELIVDCIHVSEINTKLKYRESFTNLSTVDIIYCKNIKDLTWLLFAPNLVFLYIQDLEEVEEIINNEKATNLTGITTPFHKLRELALANLPKLESIYWRPLPFPLLCHIMANDCPKLRKLPLDATSVPLLGGFTIDMRPRERITNIEWEDEDTKNRFLPSFL